MTIRRTRLASLRSRTVRLRLVGGIEVYIKELNGARAVRPGLEKRALRRPYL